jgi:hypothetical protein
MARICVNVQENANRICVVGTQMRVHMLWAMGLKASVCWALAPTIHALWSVFLMAYMLWVVNLRTPRVVGRGV